MENGTREGGKGHSRRLVTRGGGGPRKGIQDDRKGCTEGRSDLGFPGGECAKHPVDKKPPSIPVQVSRCCIHPSHPLALPAMPERATIILFASLFLPHRSSSPPPPLFFRRRHHRISDCGVKNNFPRVTSFPFSFFSFFADLSMLGAELSLREVSPARRVAEVKTPSLMIIQSREVNVCFIADSATDARTDGSHTVSEKSTSIRSHLGEIEIRVRVRSSSNWCRFSNAKRG